MKNKLTFLIAVLFSLGISTAHSQIIEWLDGYGNSVNEISNNVAQDNSGNIYVTGSFNSPTLTIGATTLTNTGGMDAFIAKYDATGSPVWAVSSLGFNGDEFGKDITVDEYGNVYVIGSFKGGDISFDDGTTYLSNSGGSDFFVVKFNNSGIHQWSFTNSGGGGKDEFGNGIDCNSSALYITGSFISPELEIDGAMLTNTGMFDIFWGKFDFDGTMSTLENPSGSSNDYGEDIAVNESGNAYITGYFESPTLNFPGLTLTNSGMSDIYVARVSTTVIWANNPKGDLDDKAWGVEVDEEDNVYITGEFESSVLEFDGLINLYNPNLWDAFSNYFIAKYNPDEFVNIQWARTAAADMDPLHNFDDAGKELAVDEDGYVYSTGWYCSRKIDFGLGVIENVTDDNYSEIFIAKYEASTGEIVWLGEGHAIYDSKGTGIDVNYGCPAITGWFESVEVPVAGTWLINNGEAETSDFYAGTICSYQCESSCSGDMFSTIDSLHTGLNGIGEDDPKWKITAVPSGPTLPTPAIGTHWSGISGSFHWSYGPPLPGTNWVSIADTPEAPTGIYEFQTTFVIDSFCTNPRINLCMMVDDEAEVYLNGILIGNAASMTNPSFITAEGYPPFVTGLNTLTVKVNNIHINQMAFNIKGYVCCEADPCDFVTTSHFPGNTECCHEVSLSNHSSDNTIEQITISTAEPTISSVSGLPDEGWDISGSPVFPTNSITLENTEGTTGTFNVHMNMCIDPSETSPQEFFVEYFGWDTYNDQFFCIDTLYLQCQDSVCCDTCEYPLQTIATGTDDWSLIDAPLGVPLGPAVNIPSIPSAWGDPLDGTNWISYNSTGGGWTGSSVAPTGIYTYKTEFCICEECSENMKISLKMCAMVDDTALVYLNGTHIGTFSSQVFDPEESVIELLSPPFLIGTDNEIVVKVINNPKYYTGFNARIWICCSETSGVEDMANKNGIKVYPNPANDYLNIKSSDEIKTVDVYNFTGQLLNSEVVHSFNKRLNISDLKKGMYVLRIETAEHKAVIRKIVKN